MLTDIAKRDSAMNTAVASAQMTVRSLVESEERRTRSRLLAYDALARKVGKSASWVRCLLRGGLQSISDEMKRRLDALLIREIEAEIARLEHDLALAKLRGAHPCSSHFNEVEACLSKARSLLEGRAA